MATWRAFLAVPLPSAMQAALARTVERLRKSGSDVKWVSAEQLHLTICFLGDVEDRRIADACQAIESSLSGEPAFELQLDRLGAFPDLQRARVVWFGLSGGLEALNRLHRGVTAGLESIGLTMDGRRYHPHITLGRARAGRPVSFEPALLDGLPRPPDRPFPVDQLILFSSQLTPAGPEYTPLARFDLE